VRLARVSVLTVIAACAALLAGCAAHTRPHAYYAVMPPPAAFPAKALDKAPEPATTPYCLDAGDRLRVVVFGQDSLSSSYSVDAEGRITMPLIGPVPARGRRTAELAADIARRLRNGYIRDPSVAVEIEAYRPFFILGEVTSPGQYPYVPNMTVESAVAIAGGFSPRARRDSITVTRNETTGAVRVAVPPGTAVAPGDTIQVGERWF